MMQPDHQPELPPTARPAYENPPAGAGAAPGSAAMMASLARQLSAQPTVAAPTLLGTELPLLASQVAAVHSYRHAYGPPAEPSDNDAAAPPVGSFPKAILITDHSAKPAGPVPDAQSGKPVNLKRRKVNANRFRARPNKPPE
ncbi:MAG: hypothetical protein ICV83_11605 [Cytophagales bacterium]|nr:hypothetical protein [Cytophagales bacterium]